MAKNYIYLIPSNGSNQYKTRNEYFIIEELKNSGLKIYPLTSKHILGTINILWAESITGIIFNSLKVISKNRLILYIATKMNIPVYWWYFDTALSKIKRYNKVVKVAKRTKIFFNKDKSQFENYRALRINPIWLDQGVPSVCQFIDSEEQTFDVGFFGSFNIVHQERTNLLKEVDDKYNLVIYSPDKSKFKDYGFKNVFSPVNQGELGVKISQIKIVLSFNSQNNQPYCWSDRLHLMIGSGAFCISEYIEGIDTIYSQNKDCVFYYAKDNLLDLIEFWLNNKSIERNRIRKQGYQTAHQNYSYNRQVAKFVNSLN